MKKLLFALYLAVIAPMIAPTFSGSVAVAQSNEPVWIDVRTPAEFNAGHIESAILIPYNEISAKIQSVVPNKKQRINLYCRSGRRAEIALMTLEQLGYTNVQNMGSFEELKAQGIM